jgi:hypothetical protein
MYKICALCDERVQDGDAVPSPQHEDVFFCVRCFSVQSFMDGMSIDININHIEDVLSTSEPDEIEFDRGLKEIN